MQNTSIYNFNVKILVKLFGYEVMANWPWQSSFKSVAAVNRYISKEMLRDYQYSKCYKSYTKSTKCVT